MSYHPRQRISSALISHRAAIENAVVNAVDLSFQAAEAGTRSAAQEPDFLAYFFLDGLHRLEVTLNAVLAASRVKVTLSGVFCHQTPMVYPLIGCQNITQYCELGDLLLVSLYTPSQANRIKRRALGNAMLLQSKMNVSRPDDSDPQWQLYSACDGFHYKSPASLAGQQRSLEDANSALWYWSFEKSRIQKFSEPTAPRWNTRAIHARSPWSVAPISHHSFRGHSCFELPFSGLVWSLFNGVAGETFYRKDSPATQENAWSAIVHDLISDTANRAVTRDNAYIVRRRPNVLRGSDALRAINANTHQSPGFLVRASLGDALSLLDDDLGKVGVRLEKLTEKAATTPRAKRRGRDSEPPVLGRTKENNGQDGGMSFIIANFKEL